MPPDKAYNLLDEEWLPVIDRQGEHRRVSLRGAFEQATEIRELRADSPLVTVSLHRLLLAILYRVCPPMTIDDWGKLWKNGLPVARIHDYLERHREGFWLVHPTRPWLQKIELSDKDTSEDAPITKLMIGAAAKNNRQIFDHSSDNAPPMVPPADAPGLLLSALHWSAGGGKAPYGRPNFMHGTLVGSGQVLLAGKHLAETLILSIPPQDLLTAAPHSITVDNSADSCPWEETAHDVARWLLWSSRWIFLRPEFESGKLAGFRKAAFTSGDSVPFPEFIDPWCSVSRSDKTGWVRVGIREDKTLWRDFVSLFNIFGEHNGIAAAPLRTVKVAQTKRILPYRFPLRPTVTGYANDQAKIFLWREAQFRLPGSFLDEQTGKTLMRSTREAISISEQVADCLRTTLCNFASSVLGSESIPTDKQAAKRLQNRLLRQHDFWGALETPFHEFLARLEDSITEAECYWRVAVRATAEESFRAALDTYTDNSARTLQARVTVERQFRAHINKLVPKEILVHAG